MTTSQQPKVLDIPFGSLLPWAFHFLAALVIVTAIVLGLQNWWIALLLLLGALFVFTSAEGTEIDRERKRYREYTSLFFMKTGDWIPYDGLEKIFVNRNKVRQRMSAYRTGRTADFVYDEFSAFLKLSDEDTIQLRTLKDREKLLRKATEWAAQLDIPLHDNT